VDANFGCNAAVGVEEVKEIGQISEIDKGRKEKERPGRKMIET